MMRRGLGPRFSLSRWSRRKLEAAQAPATVAPAPMPAAPAAGAPAAAPAELPPVESLSLDSDFTAFLRPGIDEQVKRAALKQLFRDPRFNVMDGLDTYIGDYTKADPIAPDLLADLLQRGFPSLTPTAEPSAAAMTTAPCGPGPAAAVPPELVTHSAPTMAAADAPPNPAEAAGAPANADEGATLKPSRGRP